MSHTFRVTFCDGTQVIGSRDERGTRWQCPCGHECDLGRDGFDVTGGRRLDCRQCHRRYFEQPMGDVYELPD